MLFKQRGSLVIKISLLMCLFLLIMALAIGTLCLYLHYRESVSTYAKTAQMIAITTAAGIDSAAYEHLTETLEPDDYHEELQQIVNEIKTKTDVMYLYCLNNDVDGEIRYIIDAEKPGDDPDMICQIGDQDNVGTFDGECFITLETGMPTVSGVFDSTDYGVMLSGFSPIFNSMGEVIGVIGVDISLETLTATTWAFGFQLLRLALIVTVVLLILVVLIINISIGNPIRRLAKASDKIAVGDMEIELRNKSHDEIGKLVHAFSKIIDSTRKQVDILTRIADGDFCGEIETRGEQDTLNQSIRRMLDSNVSLISGIYDAAKLVSQGSQELALGATQQAETLRQFSNSVSGIYKQADENNHLTAEVFQDVTKVGSLTTQSMEQMNQMSEAMSAIQVSSEKIAQVMQVIDDIAFQTNILAINAAIEAAHAGQHGKGFAVVADEVRRLAQKSAEASRETASMVRNNIENVALGSEISSDAEKGLREVMTIANGSAQSMQKINEASQSQRAALQEMSFGIEQISAVVQANSSTAEEMSSQASTLEQMVVRFRLPQKRTSSAGRLRALPYRGSGTRAIETHTTMGE